jgi:hypothetical protein
MKFIRQGKAYQLVIRNGQDLADALTLDEALWVAMSAPNSAYTCDPKFIKLVDKDNSGNITTSEVKDAIKWLLEVYPQKEKITADFSGKLNISEINTDNEVGRAVEHSAKYILDDLQCEDRNVIDLATVRKFMEIHTSRPLNGDGVMTVKTASETKDSAKCELMAQLITDAVAATGGTKDVDGSQGVTLDQYNAFLAAAHDYLTWLDLGAIPEGESATAIKPFGGATADLNALLSANASVVDDFFKLCQMQFFDLRLDGKVLQSDGAPAALDAAAWPGVTEHLKALPIVQPNKSFALPLFDEQQINPLYRGWWKDVVAKIIVPILGSEVKTLTAEGWATVNGKFAAFRQYTADIKGAICAAIPVEHLRAYVADASLPELGSDLAARDAAVADILKEATSVEQLLLFLGNLIKLCNNFISFPDLYKRGTPTLFERGRLVIDSRWFNLALPVDNLGAHSALAANSNLFIIYFEVDTKPAPTTLAAPVTIGDKGNLTVGKRGIYFDLAGTQYNAKIVKVIENPVCVKEAIAAPFSKIGKMIETKISGMSAASEKALEGGFSKAINDPKAAAAEQAKKADEAAAKPGDKSGMLMGVGVAFAALSSALAFICKTLSSMSALGIVISLVCVLAVLLLPISLLAIIKLQRQDLSSLLEGNGWAINSRLRLTRKQRKSFSRNGLYPADAEGTPRRRIVRNIVILVIVLVAMVGGYCGYCKWAACKQAAAEQAAAAQAAQQQAAEVAPAPAEATPAEAAPAAPAEAAPAAPAGN